MSITNLGMVETAIEYLISAKETRHLGTETRAAILKLEAELARKDAVIEDLRADVALARLTLVESVRPFVNEWIGAASSARLVLHDVDATIVVLKDELESQKGGV